MASLFRIVRPFLILAAILAPSGCNRQNSAERDRQAAMDPLAAHAAPKGLPTLAPLLARVEPAVVNIAVQGTIQVRNPPNRNSHLSRYNSNSQKLHTERFTSVGSGVIIDAAQGYVVTNNHVVKNGQRIQVSLGDGRQRQAKLVGTDPQSDIAILKVDSDDLKAISLGTSRGLKVGDYVIAIGDPYGIGQTTTFGIVSALGRTDLGIEKYEDFIQTDAAINPGNSGGALINMAGQLVGMNTAIYSGSGGSVGVGFAIPVDMIRMIARELIRSGKVSRGSLGVTVQDLTPALARAFNSRISAGALISEVKPHSPGAAAGFKSGDVITSLNDITIASSNELRIRVADEPPGSSVRLAFLRDGSEKTATVRLAALEHFAASAKAAGAPTIITPLAGVKTGAIPPNQTEHGTIAGVYVADVAPYSNAATAGLQEGDIILDADTKPVASAAQLQNVVKAHTASRPLLLRITRDKSILFLAIG